jgi:hypothetical protein
MKMRNIFNKSITSKLEYRLMLAFFLIHPIFLAIKLACYIYITYISPPEINFGLYPLIYVSLAEFLFGVTSIFCIFISFIFILRKQIKLSFFILSVPLFSFLMLCLDYLNRLVFQVEITKELYWEMQQKMFFFPFESTQIYLFGFILFLFLWQTKILIQEKTKLK